MLFFRDKALQCCVQLWLCNICCFWTFSSKLHIIRLQNEVFWKASSLEQSYEIEGESGRGWNLLVVGKEDRVMVRLLLGGGAWLKKINALKAWTTFFKKHLIDFCRSFLSRLRLLKEHLILASHKVTLAWVPGDTPGSFRFGLLSFACELKFIRGLWAFLLPSDKVTLWTYPDLQRQFLKKAEYMFALLEVVFSFSCHRPLV